MRKHKFCLTVPLEKSLRRPSEENREKRGRERDKGRGECRVIYLKSLVSDNDVMFSSRPRPPTLSWDVEGMSRTVADTKTLDCAGNRTQHSKKRFFSYYLFYLIFIYFYWSLCFKNLCPADREGVRKTDMGGEKAIAYLRLKLCAEVSL